MKRPDFEKFRAQYPKETLYMIYRMYIGKLEGYINHLEFISGIEKCTIAPVNEDIFKCDNCSKKSLLLYHTKNGIFCVECMPDCGFK